MSILLLSKRSILVTGLLLFLGLFLLANNQTKLVDNNFYKTREQFPPLVFLPGFEKGPVIRASAAVLIEGKTGAVLFAKNPDERRAPASTTKMMTAIVALEKGNLNQKIQVSNLAAGTRGSTIWLRSGDVLTLRELLKGTMLRSGNDGSIAIAEGVSGSVADFATLMNLKAKEIGALNTNFRNPHGLRAPSHYTTALDLAIIARYGLNNTYFAGLVKQKTNILHWEESLKEVNIKNTNKLLWCLEGADGVKTGTTNEAGHCLVASATRNGNQFISVVLNSRDRWNDSARLLEYAFNEFSSLKIADSREAVATLPVLDGRKSSVKLYPRTNLSAIVRKKEVGQIIKKVQLDQQELVAPVRAYQKWGKISFSYGGRFVEGVDLITKNNVLPQKSFWERIRDWSQIKF